MSRYALPDAKFERNIQRQFLQELHSPLLPVSTAPDLCGSNRITNTQQKVLLSHIEFRVLAISWLDVAWI